MGPHHVDIRLKQESNASLYPLFTLYPLPFILYLFNPMCFLSVQSVYTDATPLHDTLISPLRSSKWLNHSLFGGLAYKERGCDQSHQPDEKSERRGAHPWF